jgi:5-dehydro-2-deoxygluconokinase
MIGYDLIAVGRCGVDLYPLQIGRPLSEVDTFAKSLGGSAANVAVAAARYGHRVALVSRTGADTLGAYVRSELAAFNVDTRWVRPVSTAQPTPLTLCEIFPPDDFPIYFYRGPDAPDLQIHRTELDPDEIRATRVFWITGTGLSQEPSRSAHMMALRDRARAATTVLDLDYRPTLWPSPSHASAAVSEALAYATVAVGNVQECRIALGGTQVAPEDPDEIADALLDRGVRLAVVKLGPHGVLARTRDSSLRVPPVPVDVVNGLGAGDAFGGALCHGLLSDLPLERTLRFANAAGAHVAARLACAPEMPTADEVEKLLGEAQ